jgi:hypothetical protein
MTSITAENPRDMIAIDFTLLEKSSGGIENVLVITDVSSKFSKAIPAKNQKASTVAELLVNEWFVHFGVPKRVHSDKGSCFMSKLIKQLCTFYNIDKSNTSPYMPRGNGQCERFNRTLHNLLRVLNDKQKRNWPRYVKQRVFWYNVTENKTTGYSSHYLFFGEHPRLPVDNLLSTRQSESERTENIEEYVRDHIEKVSCAREVARTNTARANRKSKNYYDRKSSVRKFVNGQQVYKRIFPSGRNKIKDFYGTDIYEIVEVKDNNVYRIKTIDNNITTVNGALLKFARGNRIIDDISTDASTSNTNDTSSGRSEADESTSDDIRIIEISANTSTQAEVMTEDELFQPRRSNRDNFGTHSNPNNEPRSVLK